MATKKKKLTPCEVVLASRLYPENSVEIKNAYVLIESFSKLNSIFEKKKSELDSKQTEVFIKSIVSLELKMKQLEELSTGFIDYLKTSPAHNKIMQKRLDKAMEETTDTTAAEKLLFEIELISSKLYKFDFKLHVAVKNILKTRECKTKILKIRKKLADLSDDPKKHFRTLFKVIES